MDVPGVPGSRSSDSTMSVETNRARALIEACKRMAAALETLRE